MYLCSVLDPRLKDMLFTKSAEFSSEWQATSRIHFFEILGSMYGDAAAVAAATVATTSSKSALRGSDEADDVDSILGKEPASSQLQTPREEGGKYLAERQIDWDACPLAYWFPTLAAAAQDYLAVPGMLFSIWHVLALLILHA
jgi:hypothetical protein